MNTRVVTITIVLMIAFALISWIRSNGAYDFDIRTILPFTSGSPVDLYDWASLALIVIAAWGLVRLYSNAPARSEDSAIPETFDAQDEDDIDSDVMVHDEGSQ